MNQSSRLVSEGASPTAFSARDYADMLDAGAFGDLRVELVRGELHKMMPARLAHGEMNGLLFTKLHAVYAGARRVAIDLTIALAGDTVRAADIAVVSLDAREDPIIGAADILLVVEIADTTLGRDLGSKLADYARAGIAHYWVVDLAGQVTHVMHGPCGDGYDHRVVVPFDTAIAVPGTDRVISLT